MTNAASRAVGLANGRNPVPIVVPCHRVVGADGTLTGYAGGLERKQALLCSSRRACSDSSPAAGPVCSGTCLGTLGHAHSRDRREELLVVDASTGEPTTRSRPVISQAPRQLARHGAGDLTEDGGRPGGNVGSELQQQQLEVDTPPRTTLDELRRDLCAWRARPAQLPPTRAPGSWPQAPHR